MDHYFYAHGGIGVSGRCYGVDVIHREKCSLNEKSKMPPRKLLSLRKNEMKHKIVRFQLTFACLYCFKLLMISRCFGVVGKCLPDARCGTEGSILIQLSLFLVLFDACSIRSHRYWCQRGKEENIDTGMRVVLLLTL